MNLDLTTLSRIRRQTQNINDRVDRHDTDIERNRHLTRAQWRAFIQLNATVNQAIAGWTTVNYVGEDYIDPRYFNNPGANQIEIRQSGWYIIHVKNNCDEPHGTRIQQNGVTMDRCTTWEQ